MRALIGHDADRPPDQTGETHDDVFGPPGRDLQELAFIHHPFHHRVHVARWVSLGFFATGTVAP